MSEGISDCQNRGQRYTSWNTNESIHNSRSACENWTAIFIFIVFVPLSGSSEKSDVLI